MDNQAQIIIGTEEKEVVYEHDIRLTNEVKWLRLEAIYAKLNRPSLYDIGGTYMNDVADYWFTYKTENLMNMFLLHLFVNNFNEGHLGIGVSSNTCIKFDRKNQRAYLDGHLEEYHFELKTRTYTYIKTFCFSDLDINILKYGPLYISIKFLTNASYITPKVQEMYEKIKCDHHFGALLSDSINPDFTIESAEGDQFKVHKKLLSIHSEVFNAMLKEDTAESLNNCVKIIYAGKEEIQCMVEFIYTGTTNLENCDNFNLLMLADRYNIQGLTELVEYNLIKNLALNNVMDILTIADLYNNDVLKRQAFKFIKNNIELMGNPFKEVTNIDLLQEWFVFSNTN